MEESAGCFAFIVLRMSCYCKCYVAFLTVPWVGLQCVIVIFPDHTHLLFKRQCNHLCIYRDIKQKVNNVEKICLGRNTAYALMDAGLFTGNGLTKPLCAYLWSTYVIPRLVYRLEVQKLSRTDLESSEKFQRKCLRQIQGLTDKTPSCFTLSLFWVLPVELIIQFSLS